MIIDYSQYSRWNFCPWSWFENYVNQYQKPWTGQRSDPLCLGSLVHNGLDNLAKTGKPEIDTATLEENNPTPDAYEMALLLVNGYIRKYPAEQWPVELAEQPLRFPLWNPDYGIPRDRVIEGLAKLDGYFYVPEDTTIESGVEGSTITLARGWWGKEFKTKAFHRKRHEWIKEWQSKRQADFQILALKHLTDSREFYDKMTDLLHRYGSVTSEVQGILVCVLEKPHEYVPERKCEGCKYKWPLSSFIAKAEGYACPMCNHVQNLTPYRPKAPKVPEYFRVTVTRSPEQLVTAKREILEVALAMECMREQGMTSVIPDRDACVNNVHRHECEYFGPHTYGGSTSDAGSGFVQVNATKYMGLTEGVL